MAQESSPNSWWKRALRVGMLSFVLAALVSYLSSITLAQVPAIIAAFVLLLLIALGVLFDILGTSVTKADQSPLNAMAAKRVSGSRQALWLVKNADRVANFANDVVGDVSGAVTGAAGATVAIQVTELLQGGNLTLRFSSLAIVGLIAALTVGGKAAGKSFAMVHCTDVVMATGRIIQAYERLIGRSVTGGRGPNSSRRRTPNP